MKTKKFDLEEEKTMLVIERFKTLNPASKVLLGDDEAITVKQLLKHLEDRDTFGKQIVQVQMNMLKILTSVES